MLLFFLKTAFCYDYRVYFLRYFIEEKSHIDWVGLITLDLIESLCENNNFILQNNNEMIYPALMMGILSFDKRVLSYDTIIKMMNVLSRNEDVIKVEVKIQLWKLMDIMVKSYIRSSIDCNICSEQKTFLYAIDYLYDTIESTQCDSIFYNAIECMLVLHREYTSKYSLSSKPFSKNIIDKITQNAVTNYASIGPQLVARTYINYQENLCFNLKANRR